MRLLEAAEGLNGQEHQKGMENMNRLSFILVVILGLCLIRETSWATRAYITDSFEITLRTGPSSQNKVIAMPASGEAVEILNSQDDWSNVRLLGRQRGAARAATG